MRSLFFVLSFFCFAGGFFLRAQSVAPAAPAPPSHENNMIAFLTPEQQEQYAKARAKALENNPDLKSEGETLIGQASVLTGDDAAAKQAFVVKMDSHRQKLRAAMLREDSTLGPIFAEIDKHISEMKAKQLGQVQNQAPGGGANGH